MSLIAKIEIGLRGSAREEVSEKNTAIAYGSGSINVFATPAMIGLMENAALSSVDPLLPEGHSTVGIKVDVEHVAATPVGGFVEARSELLEIDGRRLIFKVEAFDGKDLVGSGRHERFIVTTERFLSKVKERL
ncbi:Predicted thioesterase [Desulfotomaculum arcticum]|uniref:Predicted thioesterase n=1 Tax=Desulfotruncus arcticus DSM 17038 TaxID=1121424 RepID=A0A1I2WFN1_9FIRM|nr:thioesterase family protein [Desulfotruncus arcticus]SFH00140.1 Predicted thioesterase [Desulfotomaculum arcticum] [Desulfotruncus arcticus DSM 17038]